MNWSLPRYSLPQRTADHLRELVRLGALGKEWPGEHVLSSRLGVSRRTLRVALALLQNEGLVATSQGRRRQISKNELRRAPIRATWVAFLSPEPEENLSATALRQLGHLRSLLQPDGLRVEVVASPAHRNARPGSALALLLKRNPNAAWILHHSTPDMQTWFANQNLPCVVDGTPDPHAGLPGVDLDWHAVGFHACGELARLGHRNIGVIEPRRVSVGMTRLNQGLSSGARQEVALHYARHAGDSSDVARQVRRLLTADSEVTALVVHEYRDLIPAWLTVLATGREIPSKMAMLCTDDDPELERFQPPAAHYRRNPAMHASRLRARILQALSGKTETGASLLNPEFIAGGSLGRRGQTGGDG